jgi:hypothetical protein
VKFTVRHVFHTDRDSYWNKVFFDAEYNRRLYLEGLGFKSYELIEQTGGPGEVRTRKMRSEPKSEAPAVVQKLIGGGISYVEVGRWDPKTGIWKYDITTSKLADKISTGGTFWIEERGPKKIERICEVELQVKIFGVGGVVEQFIEKTTRESFEDTARFTHRFISEKGLDK